MNTSSGEMQPSTVQGDVEPTPDRHILNKSPRLFRLSSLQAKLIIPYVILTLALAAVGTYVVTGLVTSSIRERFANQLFEASRVAADGFVRVERDHLEHLRLLAFTEGVAGAFASRNQTGLKDLLLPLALNGDLQVITAIDPSGREILTMARDPQTDGYLVSSGSDFSSYDLVKNVLSGLEDPLGDKFIQLLPTQQGTALFTSAPVKDHSGELVGVILIGTPVSKLVEEIRLQALADLILLDTDRKLVATNLAEPDVGYAVLEAAAQSEAPDQVGIVQDLKLYGREFQALYAPLLVRGQEVGWLGVVLPSNYVVATAATSRNLLSLLFALGTLAVILIGYVLSQSIARPILRLRAISQAVAAGKLDQSTGLHRSDEIGELARAFDQMTLNLRERTAEAARLHAVTVQRNKELAEINARLQTTQLQLIQSEKLAAVGQLTAGIVHDVKNPLATIKGSAELLMSEELFKNRQEIKMIHESAVNANRIVTDLLKFARQSTPIMKGQDMRETIDTALRLTSYLTRKSYVQVRKELPEEPVMAIYDAQQIEQVLINLIQNAVQAMPKRGMLHIRLSHSENTLVIAIQDNGIGIPADQINRIFDPFFTTKPEGEGTGLGLSVSYGIIACHRGQITVESKEGEGTTFSLSLPKEQPLTEEAEETERDA